MREILFRGKRIDNSEWIEGYVLKLGKESFSDPERYGIAVRGGIPLVGSGVCYNLKIDEVDPETVGQYTGLTDKNGKRIFEGDIIRTKNYDKIIGHANVNDFDTFEVMYEPCIFRLINNHRGFNLTGNSNELEIIGNIHDNPELLEK